MSADQKLKVSSLRFYLYSRPVHPELFDIHHGHHIAAERFDAQVWVTGCTHVIGFHHGRQSLVEVTADEATELPKRGLQLDLPFRGEKVHQCRNLSGINYMVNFQVESMSPMVYSRTHHELARQGTQRGMFVPFPMWMSHGLTPFTFIDYQVKPDQLHVFAFHAFPEDLTMVKTQSIFELI
jgi:hypothetical protein